MSTIEDGVWATLQLAVFPRLKGVTGRYIDRLREARAKDQAYDPEARRRLWTVSEKPVAFGWAPGRGPNQPGPSFSGLAGLSHSLR